MHYGLKYIGKECIFVVKNICVKIKVKKEWYKVCRFIFVRIKMLKIYKLYDFYKTMKKL